MKTQTIVHIVDGQVVRAEVPRDWIVCSISGEYRPPEEFREEGKDNQSRTNCTRTYLMTVSEMELLRAQIKKLQPAVHKMTADCYHEMQDKTAGIAVADYITMLRLFAADNPNARIVDAWDGEVSFPHLTKVDGFNNLYS
jgi:hypothetical protein